MLWKPTPLGFGVLTRRRAGRAGFTTENGAIGDLRAVILFDAVDNGGAMA
jgi:hypothetical protein